MPCLRHSTKKRAKSITFSLSLASLAVLGSIHDEAVFADSTRPQIIPLSSTLGGPLLADNRAQELTEQIKQLSKDQERVRERHQEPPRDRATGPARERHQTPPRDTPARERHQAPPRDRAKGPARERYQEPPREVTKTPRRERYQEPPRQVTKSPPRERYQEPYPVKSKERDRDRYRDDDRRWDGDRYRVDDRRWDGDRYRVDDRHRDRSRDDDRYRRHEHDRHDYDKPRYYAPPRIGRPHYGHPRWEHNREIVVVRPFRYAYPPHHRHHHDGNIWGLLSFTAITLAVIDLLNDQQQREHEMALYSATTVPLGETIYWRHGDASGSVTPLQDGTSSSGRYCREFQHDVLIGGREESMYGTACQNPDGSWEIVE